LDVDGRGRVRYARIMMTEQLRLELLALPLSERVEVAQSLWQSIHEAIKIDAEVEEREALHEARRRDRELASGAVTGRTHEQVMEAARQALK
jgi:putative addiction module component (TIGR02574 family)